MLFCMSYAPDVARVSSQKRVFDGGILGIGCACALVKIYKWRFHGTVVWETHARDKKGNAELLFQNAFKTRFLLTFFRTTGEFLTRARGICYNTKV